MPVWVAITDAPVYIRGRGGGGRGGSGGGGDTKAGASSLELLSLDTHRREVAGAHGEPRNVTHRNTNVNSTQI